MGNKFNADELAEKILERLTGKVNEINFKDFTNEVKAYYENSRAYKTSEGVQIVNKHLLNYYSPLKAIQTLTLKDAEKFLNSLKKKAPRGVYVYLRVLTAMFNKGVEWNYLRENVFEKATLPKLQKEKPVYVTEEQLEVILNNTEEEIVRDVIITGFYTSCRLGELTQLTWKDVNLKENLLTIGNKSFQTKGRKQRYIPIHQKVREILLKRLPENIKRDPSTPLRVTPSTHSTSSGQASLRVTPSTHSTSSGQASLRVTGYVFCKSNGYPFTKDYYSKGFKRACRKTGIDEGIHFHCLRHGAITRMIMQGSPLPVVQSIAGHAQIQTLMIYTHPDLDSLREAVNRL